MFCSCKFWASTIGKKMVMAVSGLILVGFVIGHMAGNLKVFMGQDEHGVYKLDHYAEFLRTMGSDFAGEGTLLWGVRIVLLVALIAHVASGISLSILNRKAKPQNYAVPRYRSANAASRTMLYGGLALLTFIVLHILHFTTGTIYGPSFQEGHVYSNVWWAFQNKLTALLYILAMGALSLHLYHGTWSMFQTLGVDTPAWNKGIKTGAKILAVLLFVGFSIVPFAITFGLLADPAATRPVAATH